MEYNFVISVFMKKNYTVKALIYRCLCVILKLEFLKCDFFFKILHKNVSNAGDYEI